jgi:hypothetical protein
MSYLMLYLGFEKTTMLLHVIFWGVGIVLMVVKS